MTSTSETRAQERPRPPAAQRPVADAPGPWSPIQLREVTVGNRVWLSPMSQYSAGPSGIPTGWHLAHYGARAAGGVGLVVVECTAVTPDQRTTAHDLGLYTEEQVSGHAKLVEVIAETGAVPGIQLGLAGRKSSHGPPWDESGTRASLPVSRGGWLTSAPSPIPFPGLATPEELSSLQVTRLLEDLTRSAANAHRAGYEVLELHGANGYLLHQFFSPLSNERNDEWGGDARRRMRFPLQAVQAVRAGWPDHKPLLVRLPAADGIEGGLTIDDTVSLAAAMHHQGVDLIDISHGLLTPSASRLTDPLANAVHGDRFRASGLLAAVSGAIEVPQHLHAAVPGAVDAVMVGRTLLRDPFWPLRARSTSGHEHWPRQYHRAF